VRRACLPLLLSCLALAGCGASSSRVLTIAAYTGPPIPAPVPVSTIPAQAAADALCRSVIPGLRASILTTYALDGESLSPAELQAQGAQYTRDATTMRAFALRLDRAIPQRIVRAEGEGLLVMAAGLKVLGKSVSGFPTLAGNANLPGALAAIAGDVAGIQPFALVNGMPDCAP
jgi:hypothetical protein